MNREEAETAVDPAPADASASGALQQTFSERVVYFLRQNTAIPGRSRMRAGSKEYLNVVLMDDAKAGAAGDDVASDLDDKATTAVSATADVLKADTSDPPGGVVRSGLIGKGRAVLESDGDDRIDRIEKAKELFGKH